jgi:prolipoprotein diacylglyceryltransferase
MNPFSLLTGLGASLGLLRLQPRFLKPALIVLAAALVGARAEYVLRSPEWFSTRPLEALMTWEGGLGWTGALAAAILAVFLIAATRRMRLTALADSLVPMLLPLVVSIWLGCWQAGAAAGIPVEGAWWALPGRDELGVIVPRWPVQMAGACISLVGFILLERAERRFKIPGLIASLSLTLISGAIAALTPFTAAAIPSGFPSPALAALGLSAAAILLAGVCLIFNPKTQRSAAVERPLS